MATYDEPVKILCVDDERNVLRALERIFLDDDYEMVLANSGEEGLAALESSGPFQIVISDYRMPVMNGVQFLSKVYESCPDTVRIVLSGYADAGAIVEAINEGHIYKFIPKPWNDDELRVTINNCLERYFLLKKNRELVDELSVANQILEEKVRIRTERLEIQLAALEFSQQLLSHLPVGVVGIDENGMIVVCNSLGNEILGGLCEVVLGGDVRSSCSEKFAILVEDILQQKNMDRVVEIHDRYWRVLGRLVRINESDAVLMVFVEVSP
jgi:two-component system NtrC family sensor kinase